MHNADDPITWTPKRIAVAGVSGSGKTTLCDELAEILQCPRVEIDSLYHGANWTPRETFLEDVRQLISGPSWAVELQYREARPLMVARADTVLWLDYPVRIQMARLIRRTVRRRLHRVELWNKNHEPPLWKALTDEEHILRWGWRTRKKLTPVIPTLTERFPGLHVVRLTHPSQTSRWVRTLAKKLDVRMSPSGWWRKREPQFGDRDVGPPWLPLRSFNPRRVRRA
ncbi:AAA family ATPase [Dietzia cinnamea]|uniref:AAA family ATPase n=1 Tax=Dietzia cinnamea TaxID=321318 RepID=UPI0021A30FD6|nr:AAA family ATPase [Dietzia cinnamea]MCT1711508.1 AAA family ATPase [Dietzia cinnamea]